MNRNPIAASGRKQFRRALLRWYQRRRRALPWRGESGPYRIWVSEVMLQQTRVAVVRGRYPEFLREFPSLRALARAPLSRVLARWSGLGYYRRARNLHAAARELARAGKFPRTSAELLRLPGFGRYTAAAVASIAFGEPVAVVDGNVQRVLHRLFALPRRTPAARYWKLAQELLAPRAAGNFNQAMMELGATVCLPTTPRCPQCPVRRFCAAPGAMQAPASAPRRRRRQRWLLACRAGKVLLAQRPGDHSLMPGMWELLRAGRLRGPAVLRLRHSITNTDFEVSLVVARGPIARPGGAVWVQQAQIVRLPLTGLARKLLRRALPRLQLD